MAGNPIGIAEMQKIFSGGDVDLKSGDIAARIGETSPIDESQVNSLMEELSSVKELKDRYESDRAEIEGILAETNSNALYSGDLAQANRRRLLEVEQELELLTTKISELSGMISTVKEYNEYVKKIKAGQKYQLLCTVADKINEEAEAKRLTYVYSKETYVSGTSVGNTFKEESRDSLSATLTKSRLIQEGADKGKYENSNYRVAYINYWDWDKHGKGQKAWYRPWTWGDDNEQKLAQKIRTVGDRLHINLMPY